MKTIITIGRQYGSAGHSIGKILADGLGIKYYVDPLAAHYISPVDEDSYTLLH